MKKTSVLYLILFLSSFYFIDEPETFGRLYRQHETIYSVRETQDGGFILASNKGIIKTKANGRIEWQKLIEGSEAKIVAIQIIDGSYIIVFQEAGYLKLNQYDVNGNPIISESIQQLENRIFRDFMQTFDGGYLFLLPSVEDLNHILLKLNPEFETEWQSIFEGSYSLIQNQNVIQTADSGYLAISTRSKITKFNAHGDTLWTNYENSGRVYLPAELSNGDLILCGNDRIGLFDSKGTLIREKLLATYRPQKIVLDEENGSIFLAGESVLKLDLDFNIIWQDSNLSHSFEDLILAENNNFLVLSGKFSSNGFLLKASLDGGYEYLMLSNPADGQILRIDENLTITWHTTLQNLINISYSANNGQSWNEIVSNFPADSQIYFWHTPGLEKEQFLIRIESSENPHLYDQHDFPLTLIRKNYDYINVNEIRMWFGNNGDGSNDPNTNNGGFYWPGGEQATQSAIFQDGLLWGGFVGDSIRVNGNTHGQGLQPGNILNNGKPANKDSSAFGIWKTRKNWQSLAEGHQKDRLNYDWTNWPVDLGAPWIDNNNDGIYDPQIDQPEIIGDELNWMVMNDLDTIMTRNTYGSDPIGMEIKLQIYAYNQDNDLADVVFKEYKLYNKGNNQVDSMYLAYWSDPDLGNAGDDYVGCDTLLNLAYCFNADDEDNIYEAPVPAVGYLLLQGPLIGDDLSLQMTSFLIKLKQNDPPQGTIEGSYEFYNNFQGKFWNGNPVIDPHTNIAVKYSLAGDPAAGTGWYEGDGWPSGPAPGDRRMVMSSGPLDFAPGDSQEVVYAIIIARGDNHLDSVTELKRKAAAVREFYYTGVLPTGIEDNDISRLPKKFELYQNYPNPFNPTTIINYTVGAIHESPQQITLTIYDILGREIKTLINKEQPPGKYQVTLDAWEMASGVYFYKLKAGNFVQTKKMVFLK